MNQGKYIFSQIVTFLPARVFDRCADTFQGDKWVKHFTCWNQLMCMIFGQLSNRDSLRDLLVCLNAHKSKHYHLGFGKSISRSNLAVANEKRDCKIFEMFAYEMIAEAQRTCISDSTSICLSREMCMPLIQQRLISVLMFSGGQVLEEQKVV
jgi:hypothetical protein